VIFAYETGVEMEPQVVVPQQVAVEEPHPVREQSPVQKEEPRRPEKEMPPQEITPEQVAPEMREKRILELISKGLDTQEIAKRLGLPAIEVGAVLSRLMNEYGVTSREALVERTRQKG
jgi:DNA-binding NarL/FixJ family response regulator